MATAWVRWSAVAGGAALLLSSCSHGPGQGRATAEPTTVAVVATTTTSTSTTVAPATTTITSRPAAAAAAPAGLGRGARGPDVQALEQRLVDLRFDPGPVDGVFDSSTQFAVTAFQKVSGMSRTGRATPDVLDRLATATVPGPLVPGGGATRVEVDLPRQVLFLYEGDSLFRILPVSTGSGRRYCVDGECARAVTPGGSFRVTWRIRGWHRSRLGLLYNPLFFNGGIAIHGAPSVPAYPASHGCVRIPMYAAGWFPAHVPNGTPVYVVGGARAPVPFNLPAPNATTTSTSTPAPTSSSTSSSTTSTSTTSTTLVPPPP
jgi:peptidoglycan hydrolase-like protein with peptidoglycan-binding domain